MQTHEMWETSSYNGGLDTDHGVEGSVRVRLPGCAAKVINKLRPSTGGFITDRSALGLPGFKPSWSRWQFKGTRGRNGNSVSVGSFKLGVKFKKDHVVRECLGVLPEDRPRDHSDAPGPLSFVSRLWKSRHMRLGFHPSTADIPKVAPSADRPLQKVHWRLPAASAYDSLNKLLQVKRDPGLRRGSEAPAGARLRQRARWVLGMNPDKQSRWLGALLSGRWTPDLTAEFAHPAGMALVAARGGEVKFLGGGTVEIPPTKEGEEPKINHFVNALVGNATFRLFPELLARLASYATLRTRDATLVTGLRTRCLEWCKAEKFSYELTAEVVGPTVALAYLPTTHEQLSCEILRSQTRGGALPSAEGWWSTKL